MACSCRSDQRADESDRQRRRVNAAQPAVLDQAAQDVVQPLAAVAHALVEVEAAALGEANAVRHQDAKQLLLARFDIAVERGVGEAQ